MFSVVIVLAVIVLGLILGLIVVAVAELVGPELVEVLAV